MVITTRKWCICERRAENPRKGIHTRYIHRVRASGTQPILQQNYSREYTALTTHRVVSFSAAAPVKPNKRHGLAACFFCLTRASDGWLVIWKERKNCISIKACTAYYVSNTILCYTQCQDTGRTYQRRNGRCCSAFRAFWSGCLSCGSSWSTWEPNGQTRYPVASSDSAGTWPDAIRTSSPCKTTRGCCSYLRPFATWIKMDWNDIMKMHRSSGRTKTETADGCCLMEMLKIHGSILTPKKRIRLLWDQCGQ